MSREFTVLEADLEARIRAHVVQHHRSAEAADNEAWLLRGAKLPFYRNTWLAHLAPAARPSAVGMRMYFLVRVRQRSGTIARLEPLANAAGTVERANQVFGLRLSPRNVLDYLNFYYAFTPKEDALLANLNEGSATQFAVPLGASDIAIDAPAATGASGCGERCLALGAVWHFLDEDEHRQFVIARLKHKHLPYVRFTGRFVIQFRDAIFAADFVVPAKSGKPVLSNPELLFQSDALALPVENPKTSLRSASAVREVWSAVKDEVRRNALIAGPRVILAISWAVTGIFTSLWLLTALFPIFEMMGSQSMRRVFQYLSDTLGLPEWPQALLWLSVIALGAFLSGIIYTTHMDKLSNLAFRLCPKRWRTWFAWWLDGKIEKWDRDQISQDTFRKRAVRAVFNFFYWSTYVVLAFASLQIALNIINNHQSASAVKIVLTLAEQAALNIPLIFYVLLRVPGLLDNIDPVADGVLSEVVFATFHAVIVAIVLRGIYRLWVFNVEASPHAFYRRRRHKRQDRFDHRKTTAPA
ncbi:MAG TPA: hypothetical protein VJ740_09435 [Hyphomicrobiaceae bacterium]|nr:hypothetical protein [Hyphomicrobiaceae bacterium]